MTAALPRSCRRGVRDGRRGAPSGGVSDPGGGRDGPAADGHLTALGTPARPARGRAHAAQQHDAARLPGARTGEGKETGNRARAEVATWGRDIGETCVTETEIDAADGYTFRRE